MPKIAYNPKTDTYYALVGGQWATVGKQAENPTTGERFGLINNEWVTIKPAKKLPPANAVEKVMGGAYEGLGADLGIGVVKGAASAVRMGSDLFGADNPVSDALRKFDTFMAAQKSAGARAEAKENAQIWESAKGKGLGAEIAAAGKILVNSPLDMLSEGLGTALPTLLVAAGTGGAAIPTLAVGALQGVGTVKGSIYDTVKQEFQKAGVPEAEAEAAAVQAQSYAGENFDQLALGGALGALASATGMENAVARMVGNRIAAKVAGGTAAKAVGREAAEEGAKLGIARTAATGFVKEGSTEALEGGQEQAAQNLALQRAGIATPTWEGVAGQATLEGVLGGILGTGFEVAESRLSPPGQKKPLTEAQQKAFATAAAAYVNDPDNPETFQNIVDRFMETYRWNNREDAERWAREAMGKVQARAVEKAATEGEPDTGGPVGEPTLRSAPVAGATPAAGAATTGTAPAASPARANSVDQNMYHVATAFETALEEDPEAFDGIDTLSDAEHLVAANILSVSPNTPPVEAIRRAMGISGTPSATPARAPVPVPTPAPSIAPAPQAEGIDLDTTEAPAPNKDVEDEISFINQMLRHDDYLEAYADARTISVSDALEELQARGPYLEAQLTGEQPTPEPTLVEDTEPLFEGPTAGEDFATVDETLTSDKVAVVKGKLEEQASFLEELKAKKQGGSPQANQTRRNITALKEDLKTAEAGLPFDTGVEAGRGEQYAARNSIQQQREEAVAKEEQRRTEALADIQEEVHSAGPRYTPYTFSYDPKAPKARQYRIVVDGKVVAATSTVDKLRDKALDLKPYRTESEIYAEEGMGEGDITAAQNIEPEEGGFAPTVATAARQQLANDITNLGPKGTRALSDNDIAMLHDMFVMPEHEVKANGDWVAIDESRQRELNKYKALSLLEDRAREAASKLRNAKNNKQRKVASAELDVRNEELTAAWEAIAAPIKKKVTDLTENRIDESVGARKVAEEGAVQRNLGQKELAQVEELLAQLGPKAAGDPNAEARTQLERLANDIRGNLTKLDTEIREAEIARAQVRVQQFFNLMRSDAANDPNRGGSMKDEPPVKGVKDIIARLKEAKREGWLNGAMVDFGIWFIERNPSLAKDLSLMVSDEPLSTYAGRYTHLERLMEIMVGNTLDDTVVHEVMHHLERLMPSAMQRAIRADWWSRLTQKAEHETDPVLSKYYNHLVNHYTSDVSIMGDYDAARSMILTGAVPYSAYQYMCPSEFWAVNAVSIMEGKYARTRTLKGKIKEWLADLATFIRRMLGKSKSDPILAAIEFLSSASGEELSAEHISNWDTDSFQLRSPQGAIPAVDLEALIRGTFETNKGVKQAQIAQDALDFTTGISNASKGKVWDTVKGVFNTVMENGSDTTHVSWLSTLPPTNEIVLKYEERIPQLRETYELEQNFRGTKHTLTQGLGNFTQEFAKFEAEQGQSVIAKAMHIFRVLEVDVTPFRTLVEALNNEPIVKEYIAKRNNPAATAQNVDYYNGRIAQRREDIAAAWAAWYDLSKQPGGHKLFKQTRDFHRDMYNAMRSEQEKSIRDSGMNPEEVDGVLAAIRMEQEVSRKQERMRERKAAGLKSEPYPDIDEDVFPQDYFPLNREGDYVLVVKAEYAGETGRERYHFDTAKQRNAFLARRARQLGIQKDSDAYEKAFEIYNSPKEAQASLETDSAILKEVFKIINNSDSMANRADFKEQLKRDIYGAYLLTLPERSIRRQFSRAQKITGFSADVLRNTRTSAMKYATQLPRMKYAGKIDRAFEQGYALANNEDTPLRERAELREALDVVRSRINTSLNPPRTHGLVSFMNNITFFQLLSGVGTALAQFVSVPQFVMPQLNRTYGHVNAGKAFTKWLGYLATSVPVTTNPDGTTSVSLPSMTNSPLVKNDPDLKRAAEVFEREYDLFSQTQFSSDLSNKATAARRTDSVAGRVYDVASEAMAMALSTTEMLSRQMTALMTFDLHMKKTGNFDESIKAAVRMMPKTVGAYNPAERPVWAQHSVGKVFFNLKMFSLNTMFALYRISRDIAKSALKGDIKESVGATMHLGEVLGMTFLLGGATVLPLYTVVTSMIDAMDKLFDDDDEEAERVRQARNPLAAYDSDWRFRYEFLPRYFGSYSITGLDGRQHTLDEIIRMGAISELTGVNIGTRISLNDMWSRDVADKKTLREDIINWAVATFLPQASPVLNYADGIEKFQEGDVLRGLNKILPALFKDIPTGIRLSREGAENLKGKDVLSNEDISAIALAFQFANLQPTDLSDITNRNRAFEAQVAKAQAQKSRLLQRLNNARTNEEGNQEAVDKAVRDIIKWDDKYVGTELFIDLDTLDRSATSYNKRDAKTEYGVTFDNPEQREWYKGYK